MSHNKVWSEQAVWTLLDIYEGKWRQVEWGNLKARDWEEIAAGFKSEQWLLPRRSPLQCKNKVEDLKKKFKSKMHRGSSSGSFNRWPYFARMDAMFKNAAMAQGGAAAAYGEEQFGSRQQDLEERDEMNGEEFGEDGGDGSGEQDNHEQEFAAEEVVEEEEGEDEEEDQVEDQEVEEEVPAAHVGFKRKPAAQPWQGMEEPKRRTRRRRDSSGESCASSKNAVLALVSFLGESLLRLERSKLETQRQLLLMKAQSENRRMEMEAKSHEMFVNMQLQLAELIAQRDF